MRKKERFDPVVEKAYLKDVVDWLRDLKVLVREGKDAEEINKNFVNLGDFILHCGVSKINLFRDGMDLERERGMLKDKSKEAEQIRMFETLIKGKIIKMMAGETKGMSCPDIRMRSKFIFTKSNLFHCISKYKKIELFIIKYYGKISVEKKIEFVKDIIEIMLNRKIIKEATVIGMRSDVDRYKIIDKNILDEINDFNKRKNRKKSQKKSDPTELHFKAQWKAFLMN